MIKEEKCVSLLCFFLDSWDSLVVAIGSNTTVIENFSIVYASSYDGLPFLL
jgi:hypothetical protein